MGVIVNSVRLLGTGEALVSKGKSGFNVDKLFQNSYS